MRRTCVCALIFLSLSLVLYILSTLAVIGYRQSISIHVLAFFLFFDKAQIPKLTEKKKKKSAAKNQ